VSTATDRVRSYRVTYIAAIVRYFLRPPEPCSTCPRRRVRGRSRPSISPGLRRPSQDLHLALTCSRSSSFACARSGTRSARRCAWRLPICVPIHSLPHRRDGAVLGVANMRGGLLVCISLAVILGVTAQTEAIPTQSRRRAAVPRLLVARGAAGAVVFPVDEVQGTERFRARDLKDVPATVCPSAGDLHSGIDAAGRQNGRSAR